ncbi:MAG: UDP-N-acetylglucosamine 2-epimerase (non-hydrolyzing) [Chitinophagaceae bacterium]|jgi:UDP-N-acetylglucosamine 2-epimerase|nr:UDP-N-acetylglucosamine 2-epimerase (non-hydrolyzing) [Chitinophagaceae bacterium]OQY93780.1 MAG: UDP-N-acetylglucosamine 2-epimerase (non-hydrolyzing) [Sphingobacteriales bacterium UTBCD1]
MKIFSIVGARPQFIKLAPLSAALAKNHKEYIVHTGQHYDFAMSEKIFSDLGIRKPDIHLEIGSGSQAFQTGSMMVGLEKAMFDQKPDIVIVFGDTNSTLAGAVSAAKLNIPILHIEAGLRSYNKSMPEEINRMATDHISKYLFAPTPAAMNILNREGLVQYAYLTGDIMVDTMNMNLDIALKKSFIIAEMNLENQEYNLVTLHRNYNVDNPEILSHIFDQLGKLNEKVIFPIHPRTKKMIDNAQSLPGNLTLIEPQGYFDFIVLEYYAKKIITDSGGIQKEAYILKKPCITLRTETEWVETVEEGWNLLVSPASKDIAIKIMGFETPLTQKNIFGQNVTNRMIEIINQI